MSQYERRLIVSGGIGSGKSAVRRVLDELGFFTVDADSVGHEVLAEGGPAFREVSRRWPDVLTADRIDRAELARVVFADPEELEALEQITHPYIFGMIERRIQGIPDPVAVEIPLLDHRLGDFWRRLIVDCEDRIRIDRLLAKGWTEEDARARIDVQPSRAEWLSVADMVVPNHGTIAEMRSTVLSLVSDT